jgi:hypothetical protein
MGTKLEQILPDVAGDDLQRSDCKPAVVVVAAAAAAYVVVAAAVPAVGLGAVAAVAVADLAAAPAVAALAALASSAYPTSLHSGAVGCADIAVVMSGLHMPKSPVRNWIAGR